MSEVQVIAIETPNLGNRSYIVGRDKTAIVIDPQRDIDRILEVLEVRGWNATHVLETHFHNDYVSGGRELARSTAADYVVPAGMPIGFSAISAADEDEFNAGVGMIRALHTPGHTPNHLSYSLSIGGRDLAVFTGGSMLYGSVGRPDLLGPDLTEPLARAQWRSMRRLASAVTPSAAVYPTHGFGSFCSATATVGTESTLLEQIEGNPAFSFDEGTFVAELIGGLDAFPAYYAHMGPANLAGAGPVDLSLPAKASAGEIARRIAAGEWVVDIRHRRLFAEAHIKGSLSFDLRGNAVTYLGWLMNWGAPITLLGSDLGEIQAMQRELVRIGIDRPAAFAVGSAAEWSDAQTPMLCIRRADHQEMAHVLENDAGLSILDIRRESEYRPSHVRGAKHVPLHELSERLDEVLAWAEASRPPGEVWIYCESGMRASVGASLLERAGVHVVLVDDDFANAKAAGLPLVGHEPARGRGAPCVH